MNYNDFMSFVHRVRPIISARYSDSEVEKIMSLLGSGAFQLDGARFGEKVFSYCYDDKKKQALSALGEDHTTYEIVASSLVFKNVVSAIDLCAAALYRMYPVPTEVLQNEADVKWLSKPSRQTNIPSNLLLWLRSLIGDINWKKIVGARHSFTHRDVRRDLTVDLNKQSGALRSSQTAIWVDGNSEPLDVFIPVAYRTGLKYFQEFCGAI